MYKAATRAPFESIRRSVVHGGWTIIIHITDCVGAIIAISSGDSRSSVEYAIRRSTPDMSSYQYVTPCHGMVRDYDESAIPAVYNF